MSDKVIYRLAQGRIWTC